MIFDGASSVNIDEKLIRYDNPGHEIFHRFSSNRHCKNCIFKPTNFLPLALQFISTDNERDSRTSYL